MVIGIDASRAFLKQRTGIEEYAYQVIKYLRDELNDEEVILYIRKGQCVDFDVPKNWRIKEIAWPRLWTQCGLAWEMMKKSVDVLFVPAHTAPWIHPKKTIVTVHGLEYEIFPEAYSRWERFYMRLSIQLSCRWASKIVAVSENTKEDLMRLYDVPGEKIEVVYEGTSRNSQFPIFNSQQNPQFRVPSVQYILFIGRIETRKNVKRILEAFEIMKQKYKVPHKLVLVGKPGVGYARIKGQVSGIQGGKDVVELGYVSEEEKWELLKHAEVFLFPSLYEGFGLPVLEAQASGVPVVTSNTSSLPEVAGKGAILVDPLNAGEIAKAVYVLISDKKKREQRVALGRENIKRFSWEKCAGAVARQLG